MNHITYSLNQWLDKHTQDYLPTAISGTWEGNCRTGLTPTARAQQHRLHHWRKVWPSYRSANQAAKREPSADFITYYRIRRMTPVSRTICNNLNSHIARSYAIMSRSTPVIPIVVKPIYILCFVDRASRHNCAKKDQLNALRIFRQPLHVSGVSRPIIRRYNRMYTTIGTYYSF